MFFDAAIKGSALDNLDRGVVLAAISGLVVNIYEQALFGFLLTLFAAILYTLIRNRVQNLDHFADEEFMLNYSPIPNLKFYAILCQWLASKELYYGLLDDLCENYLPINNHKIKGHLRKSLFKMVMYRIWIKLLSLFGLDRLIS